jgi:hypothetical protein
VEDEERGLLFNDNDADDLVNSLLRIKNDLKLRENLTGKAIAFARQHTVENETAYIIDRVFEKWPFLKQHS